MPTAAITLQQSAVCERHGGIWKTDARRLLDKHSVKFVAEHVHRVAWLTAAVTWPAILPLMTLDTLRRSGFSDEGLRLPDTLLDQTGRLSLHERVTRDRTFSERIAMVSAAHRSITSLRYGSSLVTSSACRSRSHGADPARQLFQVGDVVYCWRGNGKAKREWAKHLHGPATVVGLQHESQWLAHQTTTVKCSKGHVRHATASEQLPLGPMLDALLAPPVAVGRDMQVSEDLFMDLDTPSLKRSRDTPSSTQTSDFADANEFAQRAQTASVPPKRVGTVVVVGTAVATRSVRWCVSGFSETEQGDAF